MKSDFKRIILSLCTIGCLASAASAQQHPNLQRGFAAERVYQFGDLDSVNVFNGNVSINIPIGQSYPGGGSLSYQLTLSYNSKLWDHQEKIYTVSGPDFQRRYVLSIPSRRSNAGLGWLLSLGRLIAPDDPIIEGLVDDTGVWVYESPDGSDHIVWADCGTPYDTSYSSDATFIRVKSLSCEVKEVDLGDGSKHTFTKYPGRADYVLTRIEDAFGNALDVTRSFDDLTWTLSDRFGRQHYIRFRAVTNPQANYQKVVHEVDLQAAGAARAVYSFGYGLTDQNEIKRGCSGWIPNTMLNVNVPLLRDITLPDGSRFQFDHYTDNTSCRQGTVRSMTLPTGGSVAWDYQGYLMPTEFCEDTWLHFTVGVKTRTFDDGTTTPAVWQYQTARPFANQETCETCPPGSNPDRADPNYPFSQLGSVNPNPQSELVNTVITPLGHMTKHYFSIWPIQLICRPGGFVGTEFGLPFTRRANTPIERPNPDDFYYLSTETFDCNGAGCTTPLRSTYVRYDRDGATYPENWRAAAQLTNFGSGQMTWQYQSDFDGYGNYRTVTRGGNFGGSVESVSTTNYNPGSDALGMIGGSRKIPPTAPWITGTFDSTIVTEGPKQSISEFCFDTRGFLTRRRTLSGATQSTNDLLATMVPTADGHVASEQYSGGDLQSIATGPICSLSIPSHNSNTFRIEHQYVYGSLFRSEWIRSNGSPFGFYVNDADIDLSTGLPVRIRDTAGIATDYVWDAMGRLSGLRPVEDGWTSYEYRHAGEPGFSRSTVIVERRENGLTSGPTLARQDFVYDGLGRQYESKTYLPGGVVGTGRTGYNGMGWKVSESSQEQSPSHFTLFQNYDPFGRATRIVAPDSSETLLQYSGANTVYRTAQVATGPFGQTSAQTTTEIYDALGRLSQVVEPAGGVTATYAYDESDRLRSVSLSSGSVQSRSFTYDGRGFLASETHPENGTTNYQKYDARGHATRRRVGSDNVEYDLEYVYDQSDRLVEVRERDRFSPGDPNAFRISKHFIYSEANDRSKGRLLSAERYNRNAILGNIRVRETYTYGGRQGRVSQKKTEVSGPDNSACNAIPCPDHGTQWVGRKQIFLQSFSYNDLGLEDTQAYPTCAWFPCGTSSQQFASVTKDYQSGLLTGVPGFGTLSYRENGTVGSVVRNDSTIDVTGADPFGMVRPSSYSMNHFGSSNGTACGDPFLEGQPESQTILTGTSTTLYAVTSTQPGSGGGLRYQWYQGDQGSGTLVQDSGSGSYTTPSLSQETHYWVRVSNDCGGVTDSLTAVIRVDTTCTPVTFATQPSNQTIEYGQPAVLSAATVGTGPVVYQWYKGNSGDTLQPVSGAQSSVLATEALFVNTSYWVRISNCGSTVNSATAVVTVVTDCTSPPAVTTQPVGSSVAYNTTANLSVIATGSGLTYQWQESPSGQALAGATANTFTTPQLTQTTQFRARVSNACDAFVDSNPATVTVQPCMAPVITTQPRDWNTVPGNTLTISVTTIGSDDRRYQWYEGSSGDTSTPVGTNSASFTTPPLQLSTQFWVRVSNDCGQVDSATSTETVRCATAPTISTEPQSQSTGAGLPVTLSVTASGGTLSYQWYSTTKLTGNNPPWTSIPGATASSVIVSPSATLRYKVVVSNTCGQTNSSMATVTICTPPTISAQPQSSTILTGATKTLTVTAQNTTSYQWYRGLSGDTSSAVGTNSSSYTTPALSTTTSYWVRLGNSCTSVNSITATVSVCGPPVIIAQPASQALPSGSSVVLQVSATGSAPLNYQWYRGASGDTSTPVGANEETLTLSNVTANASYWVRITGPCGSADSAISVLTLCGSIPSIATQPVSQWVVQGGSALLTVAASGSAPLHYEWFRGTAPDTTQPVGTDTPSLSTGPVGSDANYWVRVRNGCGFTDSATAMLRVYSFTGNPNPIQVCDGSGLGITRLDWSFPGVGTVEIHVGSATGPLMARQAGISSAHTGKWVGNGTVFYAQDTTGGVPPSTANTLATLTIALTTSGCPCAAPTITTQPQSQSISIGSSATLSGVAGGAMPQSHEWYRGTAPDTTNSLGWTPNSTGNSSQSTGPLGATTNYWLRIQNNCGSTNSTTATVTVVP